MSHIFMFPLRIDIGFILSGDLRFHQTLHSHSNLPKLLLFPYMHCFLRTSPFSFPFYHYPSSRDFLWSLFFQSFFWVSSSVMYFEEQKTMKSHQVATAGLSVQLGSANYSPRTECYPPLFCKESFAGM